MLKSKEGFPIINGVAFVEGQFVCSPTDYDSMAIELLGVYMNADTGMSFGTCPFKGSVFSEKTRSKLRDFLKSAEVDVARTLENPGSVSRRDVGSAEAYGRSLNDAMKGK